MCVCMCISHKSSTWDVLSSACNRRGRDLGIGHHQFSCIRVAMDFLAFIVFSINGIEYFYSSFVSMFSRKKKRMMGFMLDYITESVHF